MNKIERIKSAIKGNEVDKIPYSIWTHMPGIDLNPLKNADMTYNFFKEFDIDIIKTMNNGMYSIEDFGCKIDYSEIKKGGIAKIISTPIKCLDDWSNIGEISIESKAIKRELNYLEFLLKRVKSEAPVVFTIFSPITTANKLCDGKLEYFIKNGGEKIIHSALQEITNTTCKLVKKVIELGASGIFLASQLSSYKKMDESVYKEFGVPYDLKVLEASKGWCNILHAHGEDIMFSLLMDYPVQIFNWHIWQSFPSVPEAISFTGKCIMGGLERMDITNKKKNELRHQIFDTIKLTNGRHLILSPGCVVRYPIDKDMFKYIKEVKEKTEIIIGKDES